jgi:hypothetical protein
MHFATYGTRQKNGGQSETFLQYGRLPAVILKNKTNIIGRDERFCIRYTKKFKTI